MDRGLGPGNVEQEGGAGEHDDWAAGPRHSYKAWSEQQSPLSAATQIQDRDFLFAMDTDRTGRPSTYLPARPYQSDRSSPLVLQNDINLQLSSLREQSAPYFIKQIISLKLYPLWGSSLPRSKQLASAPLHTVSTIHSEPKLHLGVSCF